MRQIRHFMMDIDTAVHFQLPSPVSVLGLQIAAFQATIALLGDFESQTPDTEVTHIFKVMRVGSLIDDEWQSVRGVGHFTPSSYYHLFRIKQSHLSGEVQGVQHL